MAAATNDGWSPQQYDRFKAERSAPFRDLVDLVEPPAPGARVADLGCGTGELTATLIERWRPAELVGLESSPSMLAEATSRAGGPLRFQQGDLAFPDIDGPFDVIVANAALQWVPDHAAVLARWLSLLAAGGQLAVQVPTNLDHASHVVADEVAHEPRFHQALGGDVPVDTVRTVRRPDEYAEILDSLGFVRQHVRLQVYLHHLAGSADVVEWVKGTSLTRFRNRLEPDVFEAFIDRYRARLLEVLGDRSPYPYAFKRILFWGRLPA
ncbi:MAG TPA: methyltransferase domain-containing protein [Acidimicrobiales bacterium]|nr:methyltransferase domain-containing protein [Acidimicrobiales bacterium]